MAAMEHKKKEGLRQAKRAKLREVEAMESSVTKKFDYIKNLQAVCRAEPTPASIMVVRKALQHLNLPKDVKTTIQKRGALLRRIQKALEVLSRVERLNDAHGMYALNNEATTLVKVSKDLERATPITDEAVKMIEPLSRSNPDHVNK